VTLSRLPYVVWHYAVAARRVKAIAGVFDTASAGCVDMATWTEGDAAGLGDARATGVPRSGRRYNELTTDLIKSRASPALPGPAPLHGIHSCSVELYSYLLAIVLPLNV
jgi:hypothetical protein